MGAEPRWPRFRGADGSGQSSDSNVPVTWSRADVVWRIELEGQGHSSPCIWDKNIFLTSARKREDGQVERLLICVERATGQIRWQQAASIAEAEANHSMNNFASPTCASDGQRIVAFFGRGGIHCYDIEGNKQWSRDLGRFPGPWGTAASPIIVGEKVIQNCDAEGESFLIALNKQSGETVWKSSRGALPRGGWSTPILINTGTGEELVLNGEYGVHGYDPNTGKELWFCRGFNGRGTPSPIFSNGLLYVISSKPGDTFAVRPGGSGDVTQSHMVWHTPRRSGRNLASPILAGSYLLTAVMEGNGYCYDAPTGKELWRERFPGRYTASPIAAGGLVYFQNEKGETLVIKPGETLSIVARNDVGAEDHEVFRSCLAPSEGQIFARSDRALYCIGKPAK